MAGTEQSVESAVTSRRLAVGIRIAVGNVEEGRWFGLFRLIPPFGGGARFSIPSAAHRIQRSGFGGQKKFARPPSPAFWRGVFLRSRIAGWKRRGCQPGQRASQNTVEQWLPIYWRGA